MNPKVKKILGIVVDVIIGLFVVFAVLVTILAFTSQNTDSKGVPSIGGVCILSVQSDSMKPTFSAGDMIIGLKISEEESKNLQKDDVITFLADLNGDGIKEINTHRIVSSEVTTNALTGKQGRVYSTKGDNNLVMDGYTTQDYDIICVWRGFVLPGFGNFVDFLKPSEDGKLSVGFGLVIVLPLAVFFTFELVNFIITIVKLQNNGKRQITDDDEEEIKRRAIEEYKKQMALEAAGNSTENASSENAGDQQQ